MTNLVIHPDDRSTDFLKVIYSNLEDKTVVTGAASRKEIIELVENHDRVIMLGHGSPTGLFGINFGRDYVIDSSHAKLLRAKDHNIYIWCNADRYVEYHNLKGMYSGMFISEVSEANFCGLRDVTQEQVTESNNYFANTLGSYINETIESAYVTTKNSYKELASNNSVAEYNYLRLQLSS